MTTHNYRNLTLLGFLGITLTASAWPARQSAADFGPPVPGTYALPIVKPAADGEVLDTQGQRLRLDELTHGRVTVMSFIYTRCAAAKACPMATGVLMQLHRRSAEDPMLARHLRLVSLSFDPENDTPARMAGYSALAKSDEPAAEWRFLTTASQAKLQPILAAYGQAVDRKANPKDPTGPLNHTLRVFLIDCRGNIRNIYSSGTLDVDLVLADIQTLILETGSPAMLPPEVPAPSGPIPAAANPPSEVTLWEGWSKPNLAITDRGQFCLTTRPLLPDRPMAINPVLFNP